MVQVFPFAVIRRPDDIGEGRWYTNGDLPKVFGLRGLERPRDPSDGVYGAPVKGHVFEIRSLGEVERRRCCGSDCIWGSDKAHANR